MPNYRLNLNQQSNGDYEVHEEGCSYYPITNKEELGFHLYCKSAVDLAKSRHPYKKINGCYYCSEACHTS